MHVRSLFEIIPTEIIMFVHLLKSYVNDFRNKEKFYENHGRNRHAENPQSADCNLSRLSYPPQCGLISVSEKNANNSHQKKIAWNAHMKYTETF